MAIPRVTSQLHSIARQELKSLFFESWEVEADGLAAAEQAATHKQSLGDIFLICQENYG